MQPRTDPFKQDCRLNTALIYSVLAQKVSCCVELLKSTKLPLVNKLIRIRNSNGFNALDLAKQLGNREIVLHLTHYLAFAEQNLLKEQFKKSKLDPRYSDNYWLMKQKYGWRADLLDWNNQYRYLNPLYWNTSRSMESLSTKDEIDDDLRMINPHDRIAPKDSRKLIDPIVGLPTAVKNRDKAISNREEIEKVLSGHNLNRLDTLNLRRQLEEERLNRAMSMHNLPARKYYGDLHRWNDDDSVTSSMIFDYDLQHNVKQLRKPRMYAETPLNRKSNDRYIDQLMLSDNMFYGDPYEDLWQKETYSWFKNKHARKDASKQMPKSNSSTALNNPNSSSTLPRRMSKIEHKPETDEQANNDQQMNKAHSSQQQNFKLPPIPNQRTESYEAWLQQQELKKKSEF